MKLFLFFVAAGLAAEDAAAGLGLQEEDAVTRGALGNARVLLPLKVQFEEAIKQSVFAFPSPHPAKWKNNCA